MPRMAISVLDLFSIGIGPSSSHTVGPMRAARLFAQGLSTDGLFDGTKSVTAELFGSLGATGRGHGTDKAVVLGLLGETPEAVDVETIPTSIVRVRAEGRLRLLGRQEVEFRPDTHLKFLRASLPFHPNGMRFTALDVDGKPLRTRVYYSVGGGFVVDEDAAEGRSPVREDTRPLPNPFRTAEELLRHCRETGYAVSRVMLENESAWRPEAETRGALLRIWAVMQECVRRGCAADGTLPGGLSVRRRAGDLYRSLTEHPEAGLRDPLTAMDWVNL